MCKIGDEIDAASGGALSLLHSNPRVLDLCMAPGGFTASSLKHSPHAVVCALTLPHDLGGLKVIHRRDIRVSMKFGDITMLHTEFGVTEIPNDHGELSHFSDKRPWHGELFDLIFCDGQVLQSHEPYIADFRRPVEAVRLTVSQLILAMQRIKSGGTLIMLLHEVGAYETIKILSVIDDIAEIQLFKPVSGHRKNGTFYVIGKNLQPEHPKAVAAVNGWKNVWKELTFPVINENEHRDTKALISKPELAGEAAELLERFAGRVIELGEPIWQVQMEALVAGWGTMQQNRKTGREQMRTGKATVAVTDNAAAAVHNPEGNPDDIGDLVANRPAYSADVSVAVENLDMDS